MSRLKIISLLIISAGVIVGVLAFAKYKSDSGHAFVSYTVDPQKQKLMLYWKDDKGQIFRSIQNLKSWLGTQQLVFAMNGGMYKADNSPQGLYIEDGRIVSPLDTASGPGNFYLKPNGVFYITNDNTPYVCTTTEFQKNGLIKYATQSGPMLLINKQIHPAFSKGSKNVNVRNGVGILPGNRVVFAMSKKEINFYDFASYFKSLGCTNALYLDGLVSRTYLPEKHWTQTDGDFGVIIAVTQELD